MENGPRSLKKACAKRSAGICSCTERCHPSSRLSDSARCDVEIEVLSQRLADTRVRRGSDSPHSFSRVSKDLWVRTVPRMRSAMSCGGTAITVSIAGSSRCPCSHRLRAVFHTPQHPRVMINACRLHDAHEEPRPDSVRVTFGATRHQSRTEECAGQHEFCQLTGQETRRPLYCSVWERSQGSRPYHGVAEDPVDVDLDRQPTDGFAISRLQDDHRGRADRRRRPGACPRAPTSSSGVRLPDKMLCSEDETVSPGGSAGSRDRFRCHRSMRRTRSSASWSPDFRRTGGGGLVDDRRPGSKLRCRHVEDCQRRNRRAN
jgi:hypothetical protein